MTKIYIEHNPNTIDFKTEYFVGHDNQIYADTVAEHGIESVAREEMHNFVDAGWATTELTDTNTYELDADEMAALIEEHLL